ncbi:MAG: 5-(carboxyamino)imidazole ribonucleotide mutase [Glaciecola sp.]|jgi:5-(carboxyamino)imidazole ribonucleotide mutase
MVDDTAGTPLVGIAMGSDSDLDVMQAAADVLRDFGIPFEMRVLSAHRRAHEMLAWGTEAAGRGLKVIIAGAGGAAHLPGMLASVTSCPVIGVPVALRQLDGLDSLLSIVQMPRGVPVATVAIDNSQNAGLLAVRILATGDDVLRTQLDRHREDIAETSRDADRRVSAKSADTGPGFHPR